VPNKEFFCASNVRIVLFGQISSCHHSSRLKLSRMEPAPKARYLPSLDGLRALAILGVLASHGGWRADGLAGVTIFFVISGFLITRLISSEIANTRHLHFRNFYIRRVARLLPALLLVCALTITWLLSTGQPWSIWYLGLVGALTFSTDLIQHFLGLNHVSTYFQYTWTLAIEEQFYLLWPFALFISFTKFKSKIKLGRNFAICLFAVSSMASLLFAGQKSPKSFISDATLMAISHFAALMIGAAIALVESKKCGPELQKRILINVLGIFATIILIFGIFQIKTPILDNQISGTNLIAFFAAIVVFVLANSSKNLILVIFENPFLRHIGKLSYTLYLTNMLILNIFVKIVGAVPKESSPISKIIWALSLYLISLTIYFCLEIPMRKRINLLQKPVRNILSSN